MARAAADQEHLDGVLILGAGLAGLSAAHAFINVAAAPRPVLLIAPEPLMSGCSSAWAQGGMAVALSPDDDAEQHALDTIAAGAGLVDPAMARLLTREGPDAVRRLADLGAPFDRDPDGAFAQGLEAAHSRPRIAKVKGDQAGRAIMEAVTAAALAQPRIRFRQGRALALLRDAGGRVRGALIEQDERRVEILANAVILATGGIGGLYAVTTNPAAVRGEGLALAALAGARIADPEFMQFHPTAIDLTDFGGSDPAPLASEALRGEGARLVDRFGTPFMARCHAQAELAPRDVVARAIHRQIADGKGAYLDCRQAIGAHFPTEFPTVFAACMAAGIDPRVQPIPVAPAAHYHMGGVWTDDQGRTSLPGLYAVGECACTGVHGANRLASNSLLEAAVFGTRAGLAVRGEAAADAAVLPAIAPPTLPQEALQTLRQAMSREAGVVRDGPGLRRLLARIDALTSTHGPALPLVAARILAKAALNRTESRGGHWRSDYPDQAAPRRTFTTLADLSLEPAE